MLNAQLIQNFNSMVICCIECGGTNLTKNGPRVKNREIGDEVVVCEQFIETKQPNYKERVGLFAITCVHCNNCGRKFSVTHEIMEKFYRSIQQKIMSSFEANLD
jgi:hypothetical protein